MATYTIHGSGWTHVGIERKKEWEAKLQITLVIEVGRSTYVPRVRRRQTLRRLVLVLVLVQVRLST